MAWIGNKYFVDFPTSFFVYFVYFVVPFSAFSAFSAVRNLPPGVRYAN